MKFERLQSLASSVRVLMISLRLLRQKDIHNVPVAVGNVATFGRRETSYEGSLAIYPPMKVLVALSKFCDGQYVQKDCAWATNALQQPLETRM